MTIEMSRRKFVGTGAAAAGGVAASGGLSAFYARGAFAAQGNADGVGYGPLVNKGDLWLPADFNYQVISRQGTPMSDGQPTPGIFDGMGAFPDVRRNEVRGDTTILIRNHENRERAGEQKVVTGPREYDPSAFGGCTKLVVRREKTGERDDAGNPLYTYEVLRDFAILGGTSTNCAGGVLPHKKWVTCEEVVKRSAGFKHGYAFEVNAMADGPVQALPIPTAGRFAHEAVAWTNGIMYETEDRSLQADTNPPVGTGGTIGSCFYRWVPEKRVGQSDNLASTPGVLQAAALRSHPRANMDTGRNLVGVPQEVVWVTVDDPDHDDDTDNRRDRVPGFIPTRVQAIDKGACFFDRTEGIWEDHGKVYFDCTTGGPQNLGQVWEYDPGRETLTLIYESRDSARLENPDNVVIVPQTGDIFLQEDSDGDQFVRGLTQDGRIYDFAKNGPNSTEFCGGCFDPDGQTLYLNQQGERGGLPDGPPDGQGVTYAIYGPFEKRIGNRSRNFGNGRSV